MDTAELSENNPWADEDSNTRIVNFEWCRKKRHGKNKICGAFPYFQGASLYNFLDYPEVWTSFESFPALVKHNFSQKSSSSKFYENYEISQRLWDQFSVYFALTIAIRRFSWSHLFTAYVCESVWYESFVPFINIDPCFNLKP